MERLVMLNSKWYLCRYYLNLNEGTHGIEIYWYYKDNEGWSSNTLISKIEDMIIPSIFGNYEYVIEFDNDVREHLSKIVV